MSIIDSLVIVQLVAMTTFLVVVALKYGILETISKSYFALGVKSMKRHYFTAIMWAMALPFAFILATLEGAPWYSVLALFLCTTSLSILGTAGNYRKDLIGMMHNIGALGSIVFGFLSVVLIWHSYIIIGVTLLLIGALQIWKPKNVVYWQEVVSIYGIAFGILFKIL